MNELIATLEIIRYMAAIALCVALFGLAICWLYQNVKETAETEVKEELQKAIEDAARPVVKVEISTKGRW